MDLSVYFKPLLKWWWLLLAAALVASMSSYWVIRQQPPVYQTHTTLVIGRAVYEANPTSGDLYLGQQLASFYADIGQREQVRNETMKALGLTWLPQYIVRTLPNSQLLEIDVTDTSPVRAQAVANELANQLILQSPSANQAQDQEQQQFVRQQISYLEGKIKETLADIDTAEKQLANMNSAGQIADAQANIAALQTKLSQLQSNYAALLSNTQQGANNTLSVIERASLPTVPIGPRKGTTILLSAAIALVIAAGAAYLLEYLDDTLKSPEEITQALHLPVIGNIAEITKENNEGVYVSKNPRSVVAEAFRSLRINLDFMSVDEPLETLLITSQVSFEGKTSIATNLAIVMAQAGKKVILLDADLRRPNVHRNFELSNHVGLSDVFRGNLIINDAIQLWKEERIAIITTGDIPPNPVDLLSSNKMDRILDQLKELSDVVIIDGPPLIVPDAVALSTKVDGVLMVIKHAVTRRKAAQVGLEQLNRVGARMVGIVLNKIPRASIDYYGRYRYSDYYQAEDRIDGQKSSSIMGSSILTRFFGKHPQSAKKTSGKEKPGSDGVKSVKQPGKSRG